MQTRKQKSQAEVKKLGRPKGAVKHRKEDHCEKIVEWISNGKTLRDYCRQENAPSFTVVYKWLEDDADFSAHFARAREIGYDVIAQECLAIADSQMECKKVTRYSDGETTVIEDALGHRKLQIETRLKLLAKWSPKKYGEKVELSGDSQNPLSIIIRGDDADV